MLLTLLYLKRLDIMTAAVRMHERDTGMMLFLFMSAIFKAL